MITNFHGFRRVVGKEEILGELEKLCVSKNRLLQNEVK